MLGVGEPDVNARGHAEPRPGADGLQRPLRSCFRPRLRSGVMPKSTQP
jgi:hypothetical protein